jgi:GH35 family endo-1,4-beta-xylanase
VANAPGLALVRGRVGLFHNDIAVSNKSKGGTFWRTFSDNLSWRRFRWTNRLPLHFDSKFFFKVLYKSIRSI